MNYLNIIKKNAFPFIWEALFILLSYTSKEYLLYINFLFFAGLIVYFHKEFSMKEFAHSIRNIKGFWIPLLLTLVAICIMYEIKKYMISTLFWNMSQGVLSVSYKPTSWVQVCVYFMTVMLMVPVAEALFYRKYLINFSSKKAMFITALISMVLLALIHAHAWPAALEYIIMALPVLVVYMATKNMYVSLLVQLGFCIYTNGQDLIYVMARLYTR
ncbi:MAG: CPBP family intramembrane metalloprotease [Butyrivibrio sp.]|nr:CPBP family intramembrane metalloprotease [Butyrivibrio sp.]